VSGFYKQTDKMSMFLVAYVSLEWSLVLAVVVVSQSIGARFEFGSRPAVVSHGHCQSIVQP